MQQLPGKSELKINGEWIYTENKFELRITILDFNLLTSKSHGPIETITKFLWKIYNWDKS